MIHMRAFMPANPQQKLTRLLHWSQLKQEQLSQAIFISKDSVVSFLQRQLEKGNWDAVRDVLKGKPMTKTGKLILGELRNNIATNLIMRLGLRKVIAVGIAIVLLPLILAKVGGEIVSKLKNR